MTKQVPGLKDLDYEDCLQELDLPTLIYIHHRGDMIKVYKLTLSLDDPGVSNILPKYADHIHRDEDMGLMGGGGGAHQKAVQK